MKNYLVLSWLLFANVCFAQFADNFSDGDFAANPNWAGNTNRFVISSGQLRLQAPAVADVAYLSTVSLAIENASWEFFVKLDFNPSSGNYTRVYLTSDQADLSGSLNGYFVLIGDTPDEISLYRQTGTTRVKIIDGADGRVNLSVVNVKIKVTRDADGLWSLFSDVGLTNTFQAEGNAADVTHTSSLYAGVFCNYTATRNSHFYFDNFVVTGAPVADTAPPVIQDVEVNSSTEVTLIFNEPLNVVDAETPSNFAVSGTPGIPTSSLLLPDQKSVKLTFASPFENGVLHTMSFSGIKDIALNSASGSVSFRYFVAIPATFNDVVINELFPDPSPQVGLPSTEFIELYNRSNKPFDLSGWQLRDLTSVATLPSFFLLPGHYLIVCNPSATAEYTAYGEALATANFPTLNNAGDAFSLIDPNGEKIDSVNYSINWFQDDDKAQGGYTLERLNPDVDSNEVTNWRASTNENGGTPGTQNSVFGKNPDVITPTILSVEVLSPLELKLIFSEVVDGTLAEHESNYRISNGAQPEQSVLAGAELTLHFADQFVNGKNDTLSIESFSDLAGNIVNNTKLWFRYFVPSPPTPGCLLFNEIMADPTPVVQLPEAEYIEVVNVSASPFDLKDWELSDGTDTTLLPSFVLLPGEFLVLTSSANKPKFEHYGHVLGVANFPSLNNAGEVLVLRDTHQQKIDSLNYKTAWYQNEEKAAGGFSLERLRYDFNSTDETNWRASESSSGGTPAAVNSVFGKNPDTKSPELIRIDVVNNQELNLVFSEALASAETAVLSNFTASESLGNPVASSLATDGKQITLRFASSFVNGITYSLSIQNLRDVAGNVMAATETTFLFFIPTPSSRKDVVFTEVMADPTPIQNLPEAEYVELFNRSEHPFDLNGWQLSDGNTTAQLPSRILLPETYLILTATSQASKFASHKNVLGVPNFPSLNNEGESLRLQALDGSTIDSINFSTTWYRNSEKAEGGWALELIDPENTCGEEDNWVASESEAGGTPGTTNSVQANKPDVSAPKLESVIPLSNAELLLRFNEKLSFDTHVSNFEVSPARALASMHFSDQSLREVVITFQENLLPRTLYHLVARVTDCAGNIANNDVNKLTFALTEQPDSADVIINEVLFNPQPGQHDYVEIYNRSEKYFDLKGWTFGIPENNVIVDKTMLATDHLLMAPGSFLVFTPLRDQLMERYPQAPPTRIVQSQLPSLPNDAGGVALQNDSHTTVDAFLYQQNMHSPLVKDDEGVALERISYHSPTNDASNWTSASSTSRFGTPGEENSNSRPAEFTAGSEVTVDPEVFSPGKNFTQIHYQFEQPGQIANVSVLDMHGHAIKEIAANTTLGNDGFFRWDGDRTDASTVSSGYYFVLFELFDAVGNTKTYRKRVIVANP